MLKFNINVNSLWQLTFSNCLRKSNFMKKIFFTLVLIAFIHASPAQMKILFFNQDKKSFYSLIDSIKAVLPAYQLDTVAESKGHHALLITLRNYKEEKITVSFSCYDEKIFLLNISGLFDDLFSLYAHYLNDKATKEMILSKHCASVILQSLPDKKRLPISFCLNKKIWNIYSSTPH